MGSIAVERLAGPVVDSRHVRQASILEYWRQALNPRSSIEWSERDDGTDENEAVVEWDDGTDEQTAVVEWDDGTDEQTAVVEERDEPFWGIPFKQAFGMSVSQFYEAFGEWREGFNDGARELPDDTGMAAGDAPPGGPFSGRSQYPH